MKELFIVSILYLCLAGRLISAEPDFTVITKTTDQFTEKMEGLAKDLPSVNTASGTAEALNRWSKANEAFTDACESFLKENRSFLKDNAQTSPPREIVVALTKMSRLKEDYPAIQPCIRSLLNRFGSEPEVIQAMKRFQSGLDRLNKVVISATAK